MTRSALARLASAVLLMGPFSQSSAQQSTEESEAPWVAGFRTSAHHWLDLTADGRVIEPQADQPRYSASEIAAVADNILHYQQPNGGWPKNYDMQAMLTADQAAALEAAKGSLPTTFDNGATHSQVHYLAFAYSRTGYEGYREACLRGLDFILEAQYKNGGWPQSFPDRSGYRRYITFNDGAMIGVMSVLQRIVGNDVEFSFVGKNRRARVEDAYHRGLQCIVRCQVVEKGQLTVWCQQHDDRDFRPRGARTFELSSLASEESAQIVRFLMRADRPDSTIVRAISAAVSWFEGVALSGIRVSTVAAPPEEYRYHESTTDKVLVYDPGAPRIWARYYELGTGRPLFSNRDGKPVYSLAEVERERRTGYEWYSYAPQEVLDQYPLWRRRWTSGGEPNDTGAQNKRR